MSSLSIANFVHAAGARHELIATDLASSKSSEIGDFNGDARLGTSWTVATLPANFVLKSNPSSELFPARAGRCRLRTH